MRNFAAIGLAAAAVAIAGATVPDDLPSREIPDRVSIEQDSPFFFKLYARLGVRINGKDSQHVVEFCQSEGWVRICQRNGQGRMKRDSRGRPITITLSAEVEPYWKAEANEGVAVVKPVADKPVGEKPAISREQARYARQQAAREAKAARA